LIASSTDYAEPSARRALAKSPVLLLQLLESAPIAQKTAKIKNSVLPGTRTLHA
jgi:hypothetical protein